MSKAKFVTPKGTLKWVFISGRGRKNLNGVEEFTASVEVPIAEAKEAMESIDALWAAEKPKGAKEPKSTGYRVSEDGKTVSFTLKTKTTYPNGEGKQVRVFNAKAEQIILPDNTRIGNGSRGRLSGVAAVYDAGVAARGVTLYLDAVQLTKFVEYKEGSDFGADDEDDFEGFANTAPFSPEELV
jgi:hypothetical protein